MLVVITLCLSAQLFKSVPVPCPQSHLIPSLGCELWREELTPSLLSPECLPRGLHTGPPRAGSFIQPRFTIYCVPGIQLKAEGTMMNTTGTTVLFKSQFVELNLLSATLLFANIFSKMRMKWGLGNNRFLILKRKSRKAHLYSWYDVFLMTDLRWK